MLEDKKYQSEQLDDDALDQVVGGVGNTLLGGARLGLKFGKKGKKSTSVNVIEQAQISPQGTEVDSGDIMKC